MNNKHRTVLLASAIASVALLQGCATSIKASSTANPPPAKPFSAYSRIEVKPVVFKDGYKGDVAGLAKIDENFKKDLAPRLAQWNSRAADGNTLVVEPVVEEMSFKHGAKRVLLGPLAGSSGVLMRVTFRDNTGKVIATPEFFQRTAAFSGGYSFGVNDNMMLTRVANLASGYIVANYDKAVGGPTGADDQAVKAN
ncbi:hypothetical protein NX786_00575 [Telluria mixta]|jgi:hypothetical protein|uniref:DUF3313 domain-containing protein n=1 Tax=Telluria mixta TaxID=34071 RepID=A0ABT2BS73_9BURK|nr:hypothetical protein [Telluria mixta]MCS0627842.1 hypothetical protein [Telluria mixta]WEM94039.1 hypothetical protein P0M04_21415 [Telluria mixta]